MIVAVPVGVLLLFAAVILVAVIARDADRRGSSAVRLEEDEAKRWALAQADVRTARRVQDLEPSEEHRRALEVAQERARALDVGGGDAVAPTSDPIDQIRRLAELYRQGVISDDEFTAKKAALLDKLG
jgi:Short C-terminal domain